MFLSLAVGSVFCGGAALAQGNDSLLGKDKAEHFALSAGLAAAGYGGSALFFDSREARLLAGAGFALTLGAAKELDDLRGPGVASWADMAWNVVGAGAGLAVAYGIDRLLSARRPRGAGGLPSPATFTPVAWPAAPGLAVAGRF